SQRANVLQVPIYTDYKKLVTELELDGIIIALPNQMHREAVEVCSRKCFSLLVEKPIADSIEDGRKIVDLCHCRGVRLLVGHHRRFSSQLNCLKKLIESGRIGRICGASMFWVLAKHKAYFEDAWRVQKGGGPLLINGIHDIDDFRHITGLNVTSVYAATRSNIRGLTVEDSASVLMETKEGATVNYFLSDGIPSPWNYEADARENPTKHPCQADCYYFFGTRGSIAFPSMRLFYYDDNNYGWEEPLLEETVSCVKNDPMTAELCHFIQVVRGQEDPLVTGEDALETLRIIQAVKQSAEHKKVMHLHDPLII
ncbi:MAG: Gfo/Idh/MocA family oxidoreductase, partial [Bacillota bacterium]|nr:Gfo/Idh/MocA family oxidoreductase [Bacillota bacterium]